MSKKDREARLHQGEASLAQWQLSATATAGELAEHVGKDAAADLAIAARLARLRDPESAALLRRLEEHGSDKLVVKEAKRALFVLEQQGVAIPAAAPAAAVFSLAPPASLEGWMTPIDGGGDQLLWIEHRTATGSDYIFAVVNDPEGIRELDTFQATRKEVRAIREDMWQRNGIRLVAVDWRFCDSVIFRSQGWAQALGRPTFDYTRLRTRFTDAPQSAVTNPVLSTHDRAAILAAPHLLADSMQLFGEPEFRTWFALETELEPVVEEFGRIRDSPLVLDEAQQKERMLELVGRAVRDIFGGERRDSWVRRIETMALYFEASKRTEAAQRCLAVAFALADSSQGGQGIPWCEMLVRSALSVRIQMAEAQEQDATQSSLVLTPGQAIRDAESRKRS